MQIAIRLGLASALLLAGASARAQQVAPPPTAPPPTAPAAAPAPEAPAALPAAVAPAAETPPPTAAPAPPPPSTLAPEPVPAGPALSLDPRTTPETEEARPEPFYQKLWFWGAVGVVLATAAVILVTTAGSPGPSTPNTTLGNMNAY